MELHVNRFSIEDTTGIVNSSKEREILLNKQREFLGYYKMIIVFFKLFSVDYDENQINRDR